MVEYVSDTHYQKHIIGMETPGALLILLALGFIVVASTMVVLMLVRGTSTGAVVMRAATTRSVPSL